jgi:hypothetical protein
MNKQQPHVYVIPEDDRDRQLADGFVLHHEVKDARIQVVPPPGGWSKVLQTFREEYVPELRDNRHSHVIMLIDFDEHVDARTARFAKEIPPEVKDRVFVIGSKSNPEALKRALKISYERIGCSLADDCASATTTYWDHDQLRHNEAERQRLLQIVRPFLFE